MTKRNFTREQNRQRIASCGSESLNGNYVPSGPPRVRTPKAVHREEVNAALAALGATISITVALSCRCGHKGKVRVPLKEPRPKFRCVKCNRKI